MKNLIIVFVLFLLGFQNIYAQKPLKIELNVKKKTVIYLNKNNSNSLEYFVSDNNELDANKPVNSKGNSANIYLKWLNPLKYKLTWKDTTLIDDRDKLITDFTTLLVGQFGSQVTGLNSNKITEESTKGGLEWAKFFSLPIAKDSITPMEYSNINLTIWFLHIMENKNKLEKSEQNIKLINNLSKKLKELDSQNIENTTKSVVKIYSSLFAVNDIETFKSEIIKQETNIKDIEGNKDVKGEETGFYKIESMQNSILAQLETFELKIAGNEAISTLLNSYTKSTVNNYCDYVNSVLIKNKSLIQKLKPVLEIAKNSFVDESVTNKGYYKIRNIEFEDGKVLQTNLIITEYEFNSETINFSKKGDVTNENFKFQKYDPIDVWVSVGLFWGDTTLKGFGVGNDENNNLIIKEDDINKNTAVSAIFLNFDFIKSRYLSPLFQLGIDPTKKKPFLLLGAGFSIPSARIAFSAGPIWTWNQTLGKLNVGDTVSSTTDLEKDIEYTFDMKPKGWYIGIQYNFNRL